MGWMVNHVQVGDRVAVVDHKAGQSAAVEPGQPENSRAVHHGHELSPDQRLLRTVTRNPGGRRADRRLRARNELVGLWRPSAQIDHSRAPAHPEVGRTPTGPEA